MKSLTILRQGADQLEGAINTMIDPRGQDPAGLDLTADTDIGLVVEVMIDLKKGNIIMIDPKARKKHKIV